VQFGTDHKLNTRTDVTNLSRDHVRASEQTLCVCRARTSVGC
jgi:hypothetical protein